MIWQESAIQRKIKVFFAVVGVSRWRAPRLRHCSSSYYAETGSRTTSKLALNPLFEWVPPRGIEPRTFSLQVSCSTC